MKCASGIKNDYVGLIRSGKLLEVIQELQSQGMTRPTLRACYYILLDRRTFFPAKKAYEKLDAVVSCLRDSGNFPYGLLSPDAGTDKRGLLPDELEEAIKRFRTKNVPPELCNGILKAVMVEKRGLVDYLVHAVQGRVAVGSPEGNLRKEWAYEWCQELDGLAHDLGASEVQIIYLGDCDEYGNRIKQWEKDWFRQQAIDFEVYACEPHQLKRLRPDLHELHIDGYIALIGPDVFAKALRRHLGLSYP